MNVTFNTPLAVLATVGVATGAGEPTMTGNEAAEDSPVPRTLCSFTVHV